MKNLTNPAKILISTLHGLILFFPLWYINSTSSFSTSVDEGLLKKIFIFEDLVLPNKFKSPHEFVFINVSKDISIVQDLREYGDISITDRKKLGSFFKILADNNNQHDFVLCDIFFEYPSEQDYALSKQVVRCKNILFPYHYSNKNLVKPCIDVPAALADYQTYNNKFSKFKLIYDDSIKTIPYVLHEKFNKNSEYSRIDLNTFAPRYYIRPFHLFTSKKYPYFNIGELLIRSEDSSFYNGYLRNKFIVIGDFEAKSDEHYTPVGKMYGPLILTDTYLSLVNGRAKVNWIWIIFILLSLSASSYILFFVNLTPPEVKVSPWIHFIIHNVINKIFSFIAICTLIVFVSELFFSVQLIISPLFLYLVYVSWVIKYYKEHFQKR